MSPLKPTRERLFAAFYRRTLTPSLSLSFPLSPCLNLENLVHFLLLHTLLKSSPLLQEDVCELSVLACVSSVTGRWNGK